MKFSLSSMFWVCFVLAVYIAIRVSGVRAENEARVLSSCFFLSAALGTLAAIYGQSFKKIAIIAIAAGVLPCVVWALECLLQSPTTSFLRKTNLMKSYSTSLDLNIIGVIVWGTGAFICGLIAGFITRAIGPRSKHKGHASKCD